MGKVTPKKDKAKGKGKGKVAEAEAEDWDEEEYEVEYIVKSRKSVKGGYPKHREDGQRCVEYFVKWKGWDASTNTWEHESELGACTKLIEAFWQKVEKEREEKERSKREEKERKRRKKEERAKLNR